jgi:hypothetical protein
MINLYVGGADRTESMLAGSLSIQSRLNSRDRAGFTLVGLYRPPIGSPIVITDAGTTTSGTAATFTRASAATLDGVDYATNGPRYQSGVWVEEATTNQITDTDGALATYNTSNVTQAVTPLTNFLSSVQYGDNSAVRFAYKLYTHTVGVTYTFSAYIQLDDGGVPVPGAQTGAADFTIVNHGVLVSTLTNCVVELVSGSLYRVSITRAATLDTIANNGIVKYAQNSSRGFRVAGYQLEILGYRTSYAESGAAAFTRAAEALTIPSTGWAAGSWTACLSVTRETRGLPSAANTLWQMQIDASNLYRLRLTAAGVLEAVIISAGTTYSASTGATIAHNTLARIAWSGTGSIMRVAVNGALVAEFAYVEPVGTIPATIGIGGGVSGVYRDVALNTRWLDGDQLERLTATTPEWVTSAWALTSSLAGLDALRVFGGSIETTMEELVVNNQTQLLVDCDCVSYDALADRRLVARAYDSPTQTLNSIVTDIIAQDFAGEGIDVANVETGPILSKLVFSYTHANEAFDLLAELTGYSWWIDAYKKLYFADRATLAAPYTLSTSSSNFKSINVESTRIDYRNRQYVRAGLGLTASRTETLVGDGTRKSFTLAYPVGATPTTITVGGVGKTIGIREVDSGKDWYYQSGSPVINQDPSASAVGSGVIISVAYEGQYPIIVAAQDDAALTDRATVEGGSGIYDEVIDEPAIADVDSATDRAFGLLRRYARIPRKANIVTVTAGLRAGQLVTVDITQHGLTGSWLVESVSIRDYNGQRVEYQATLLDGEAIGGWQGFFGALSRQARKIEFKENEVVLLLRQSTDQVAITDTNSYTTAAPAAPLADFAICGYSELTS